jgi:hemolysin activation/secretion protein
VPHGRTAVEASGPGVEIKRIGFGGNKVPGRVAEAAKRFLGAKTDQATLAALAKALSEAYADADIALYTVVIPRQTFAGGEVIVTVAEGFVERVVFTGGMTRLNKAYALMLTKEHPLSRHTMQRYLSLMRDIPGETIDVQVLQGTRPGGVVFQIKAKRKRFDASLSFDNQAQDIAGPAEFRADIQAFSLLRDGDHTDISGLTTPNTKRLRYVALSHSTPVGDNGGTASLSVGYLASRPKGSSISGDAKTAGLTYGYPILRGYKKNLTATVGIDMIDSDSAVLGDVFSSDHTRAVRGAIGYSDAEAKSVLTGGITISRGLDVLGAHGTPFQSTPTFTKVNARVGYDHQIGQRFVGRLRASGQYSRDLLPAAERFVVGGPEYGRAFDQAVLSGDRGYATSGELAFRPKLPDKFAGSELYGFADYAALRVLQRGPFAAANYDVGSAGGGIRIGFTPRAWLQLEGARVIDQPYPGYRGKWRFNISWKLNLKRG